MRFCQSLQVLLLMLVVVQYGLGGFYRSRLILPNKTEVEMGKQVRHDDDSKVILVLCDALREDYVQLDQHA